MTRMSARPRDHCARVALSPSEKRQTGGGCVGGLLTCPRNVSSTNAGGAPSTKCDSESAAGNIAATKLKRLSAHATEPLQSSEAQQGIPGRDLWDDNDKCQLMAMVLVWVKFGAPVA